MWSKSPKPKPKSKEKENVFKDGCNHHIKREKNKSDSRAAQIENGKRQLVVMQDIGVSINCMSLTDKHYYADFKEYVLSEYEPKENRVEIINASKDGKFAFTEPWSVVVRKRHPKNGKDTSTTRAFDHLKNSANQGQSRIDCFCTCSSSYSFIWMITIMLH